MSAGDLDPKRPPLRVYVNVDTLGPNKARTRKFCALGESKDDAEIFESDQYIYEYRLVTTKPRARVKYTPKVTPPTKGRKK